MSVALRIGSVVLAGLCLVATAPLSARADVAGPVVLIGTGGVRWADVGPSTPTLLRLRQQDAAALLAVRSVRAIACPADGWLAVSAGRRAADVGLGAAAGHSGQPSCRAPEVTLGAAGTGGTVVHWADYLAQARAGSFEAHPGLLGTTLAGAGLHVAAVGPGAAIALADGQGRVERAWPGRVDDANGTVPATSVAEDARAALATSPELLAVDLGTVVDPGRQAGGEPAPTGAYARPKPDQVRALDTRLGLVLAELPANATVVVAATADSGSRAPSQLQLLAARGPGPLGGAFSSSLIGSESTRQNGMAQTTDLLPTLLAALGVKVPSDAVGSPLEPVASGRSPAWRAQRIDDLAAASIEVTPIVPWIFAGLVGGQLLIYGGIALLLRREPITGSRIRNRVLGGLWRSAVVFAIFPAATFLANLLPWWRSAHPGWAAAGAAALFTIALAVPALAGPWRRSLTGPAAVVGAITALVLAGDVATGSHLLLSSLLGVQPYLAGRFYGFSNPAFALFATGALLAAAGSADRLVRAGRRRDAAVVVVAVGLLATVIDGAPFFGADFGGPPAIVPAFGVLALLVGGIRVTWRRVLLIALITLLVIVAAALADWLRPDDQQTHLGRFVESAINGGAWPVVRRKAEQNLGILFGSWLSALLPFAAALVVFVLARPVAAGVRPLQLAYDRSPVLKPALIAWGVLMLLGALLNDSGPAVPADAALVMLPLLVAAGARALQLQLAERSAPDRAPSSG